MHLRLCEKCQANACLHGRYLCGRCSHRQPWRFKECLHCSQFKRINGRGLCRECYRLFRDSYPLLRNTRRFEDYDDRLTRARGKPTTARPGTPEKIEVLAQRASEHRPLFHPEDWV